MAGGYFGWTAWGGCRLLLLRTPRCWRLGQRSPVDAPSLPGFGEYLGHEARGLRKALQAVFGGQALVQRCQRHKRENVEGYLPTAQQTAWRRKLQAAYGQPRYPEAKAALHRLQQELRLVNAFAVTSLDEGVEETLTLHRLGLFGALGTSLKTTNCLESLNAQLGAYIDKVDRWLTSDQKQRWVASALLTMEPCLRRIKGYRHLPLLRAALQRETTTRAGNQERVA